MQHVTFGSPGPSMPTPTLDLEHQHLWLPPCASDTIVVRTCQFCGRSQKIERHKGSFHFDDEWRDVLEPGESQASVDNP